MKPQSFSDQPTPKMSENTPLVYTQSIDQLCDTFGVKINIGLSQTEALQRLATHGPNCLTEKPRQSVWSKWLAQFKNALTMILITASILSWAIGNFKDAIVILIVVIFNTTLGFYQEYRAEKALDALKAMLTLKARVRREQQVHELAVTDLVSGDIVLLDAGDRIPADGRFVNTHSLEINESALTGESLSVEKYTDPLPEQVTLNERSNMGFMNTTVTRGRAELLITATGMQTEIGRLATMLEDTPESETPLQQALDKVGKRLATIALIVISIILIANVLQGNEITKAILNAIALAIAAIPEGLPAVVTVTLAIGMYRMAKTNAIVKKLAAVETLGCTTVICSDKTGTLTLNQMTARAFFYKDQHFTVTGEGYQTQGEILAENTNILFNLESLLLPIALCVDSSIRNGELIGDPTEGAMLVLAHKGHLACDKLPDHYPRIAEITFDSAHKFMATFHHAQNEIWVMVKGAPDILLAYANYVSSPTGDIALDEHGRNKLLKENAALANRAFRVLAVASRKISKHAFDAETDLFHWINDLTFQGLIGIQDPPRSEARAAIENCHKAGIQVKMITGDHKITALAIAKELSLTGEVMTGAELDRISTSNLSQIIDNITVFARVAPEHKVKIVTTLKNRGHIVAMTGDGVNDAPALKTADIGIAMGNTGTAVAKEAANMVLADDNFATIVHAVMEGRTIFENIIKFVCFQLSTNIGAIIAVASATFLGLPTLFSAIQILWINIIMDGPPALTLGMDPSRAAIMDEAPRIANSTILSGKRLLHLTQYGLTMAIGTLAVFWWSLQKNGILHAETLAFTTFVLFQFFNVFNARNEQRSAFNRQLFANAKLWIALTTVLILQVIIVHWKPAQQIFHTIDLTLSDWLFASITASSVLIIEESRKWLLLKK